jgi:hypothetical protein
MWKHCILQYGFYLFNLFTVLRTPKYTLTTNLQKSRAWPQLKPLRLSLLACPLAVSMDTFYRILFPLRKRGLGVFELSFTYHQNLILGSFFSQKEGYVLKHQSFNLKSNK